MKALRPVLLPVLAVTAVVAIAAGGLVLLYATKRVFNLAHGAFAMAGGGTG